MYRIERDYRAGGQVIQQNSFGDMEYLTFPLLEKTGLVSHLFTTRTGGVSEGIYSSLNLSFQRGDNKQSVLTNYERVARVLGCRVEDMVASHQTHTTNIRRVTGADGGKGIVVPRDYEDVDGLVTNEPGLVLATFYADCVPLYFVDVRNRAVGLAHSGWRGTVGGMGGCMAQRMYREFGSLPKDLYVAVGPSICRSCYEVGEEVAEAFEEVFQDAGAVIEEIVEAGIYHHKDVVAPGNKPGKYQLDLWLANVVILCRAGIPTTQIAVTDICTCHNPGYLFSHRASNGQRGNLGAFLKLKES